MLIRTTGAGIIDTRAPVWLAKLMMRANLSGGVRLGPEDRVAIEFADNLRVWALEGRLNATFTHIPNEVGFKKGGRATLRYAIAKALGLITGAPDFVLIGPAGGGWIEFKSAKGRMTDEQKLFRGWCSALGVRHAIARSAKDGEAILKAWGMLLEEERIAWPREV